MEKRQIAESHLLKMEDKKRASPFIDMQRYHIYAIRKNMRHISKFAMLKFHNLLLKSHKANRNYRKLHATFEFFRLPLHR